MNRVLLLAFSHTDDYRDKLQQIREAFRPEGGIFILENRFDGDEIWITFNTEYNFKMPGFIKIHKKKETNTLFTIDAINHLSMQENGEINPDWIPNWNEFENCLLLVRNGEFCSIPTKLKEIIKY